MGLIRNYEIEIEPMQSTGSKWYLLEGVDSRSKWFTIILFVVSIGMLIAGSVMLGIGISNNNKKCDQSDVGYTVFLRVQASKVPYSSVVKDYSNSVQTLTDQMRQALAGSKSVLMQSLATQNEAPITILGISDGGTASDVMYAISYSDANKPSIGDVQSKVTNSGNFVLLSATDQTAKDLNTMECAAVSKIDEFTTTIQPTNASTTSPSVIKTTQSTYPGTSSLMPQTSTLFTAGTTQSIASTSTVPVKNTTASAPAGGSSTTTLPSTTSKSGSSTPSFSKATTTIPAGGSTVTVPAGTTQQTSPNTVQSTLTPPSTEQPVPTITPFVKTPYSKDVIILLDDSIAMMSPKNFNRIKSWINNSLLPLWMIDRENVQVAFVTYASNEFNVLLDFDESNEDEVASVIANQVYSGKYDPSILNGIRGATGIHGLRPVNQTAILLSGSENITDIESATQYAYKLNTLPNQFITVALNSTNEGKLLGLLSTSQNHYFGSSNFTLDDGTARQITKIMFGISTPTTAPIVTTPIPDISCNADITILIDCSNDVGSVDQFHTQMAFVRSLVKSWPISPDLAEAEAVLFSSLEGGMILENPFTYQSASAFANELLDFNDYYFAGSPPSITGTLEYLSKNLYNRRANRQQTTLLITYSSDEQDVQNAIPFANRIGGNLIILAINKTDPAVLAQLSGNVLFSAQISNDLIDKVNNMLCATSTRAPLRSTTPPPTSATSTTPVVTTTTTPKATTTPLPNQCPDCVPKTSNVLLLLESYGNPLANQKDLLKNALIASWNHFERVSVIGFDSVNKFQDPINFGDLQDRDEFTAIVDSFTPLNENPTILSAFNLAINRAQPLTMYGRMNSVIFTSGANADEINASLKNSKVLRGNGKVIIVGLNLASTAGLETLCDTLLNWTDLQNPLEISDKINAALN